MEFRYELNDSIQINLIGRCDGIPGTYAGRHTHPFWELVLMMEGEGKQLSCDEVLEVGKDSLWLIPNVIRVSQLLGAISFAVCAALLIFFGIKYRGRKPLLADNREKDSKVEE